MNLARIFVIVCDFLTEIFEFYPLACYLLKFNNRNSIVLCEIFSKLSVQTPEQHQWPCFSFLLITLNIFNTFFWYLHRWHWATKHMPSVANNVLLVTCSGKCSSWNKASKLQKSSFLTVYKIFIRTHLGYADGVYKQNYKLSYVEKLELIQYIAALAITLAIRG